MVNCGEPRGLVYIPHDPCPLSTIVLSNARSAGLTTSRCRIQRHDHLESCTYAELRRMAESVGRWIGENGFARGSRLAILADNHPRWVAAYWGSLLRAARRCPARYRACTPINSQSSQRQRQFRSLLRRQARGNRAGSGCGLKAGLVLMDPERMANQATDERWRGNLPAIFEADRETSNLRPRRRRISLPCSIPQEPPPIPKA
jgi:hypothetical protein